MKGKEGIGRKSQAKAGRKELFKWKFFFIINLEFIESPTL